MIVRQFRVLVLAAMVAAATVGASSGRSRPAPPGLGRHPAPVGHAARPTGEPRHRGANTGPAGVALTGSGVMAAAVAALALFALAFLVVTLMPPSRRLTTAGDDGAGDTA